MEILRSTARDAAIRASSRVRITFGGLPPLETISIMAQGTGPRQVIASDFRTASFAAILAAKCLAG